MDFNRSKPVLVTVPAVISIACAVPVFAAMLSRLVVQITVDRLPGDPPTPVYDRLGENVLRFLWDGGPVFVDAHHGHTTLATGN